MSRFEARTLDDIRALGRNSEADDCAFATVARMSELFHSMYCTFLQPAIRAMANEPTAKLAPKLHPMRRSGSRHRYSAVHRLTPPWSDLVSAEFSSSGKSSRQAFRPIAEDGCPLVK
jgi:hypothetical protein